MIRIPLLLALLTAPALAQADAALAAAAVDEYRAEVGQWYLTHGTGSFDMTALADSNIIIHNADDGRTTTWDVELVGSRDRDAETCTWGWAIDALAHVPRESAHAVLDHAEANAIADLTRPTVTASHQGCAERLAHATLFGDFNAILPLPYDGTVYFFGFLNMVEGLS